MYEFFIDFLFNLINNSGWRHVSPVTRCWPGRGAAGEDISIVIAGLVSCPSDIHYFIMMDNPSEHQLCDDTLESLGNINLSVLPRKRRTVCCWEPSREVSAWVSLVNSALEPQSSRALVPFPVIRVDRFTIFQTRNYTYLNLKLGCLSLV